MVNNGLFGKYLARFELVPLLLGKLLFIFSSVEK
jgi:hypothetical protein